MDMDRGDKGMVSKLIRVWRGRANPNRNKCCRGGSRAWKNITKNIFKKQLPNGLPIKKYFAKNFIYQGD